MRGFNALAGGLAFLIAGIGSAAAEETTPEQAAQLEAQLRAWFAQAIGPELAGPNLPLHVAPDGAAFRVEFDYSKLLGDDAPAIASVRALPQSDGTWEVSGLSVPEIKFAMPAPGQPGKMMNWAWHARSWDMHMHLDPSLDTPTTAETDARDLEFTAESGGRQSQSRTERVHALERTARRADGRGDLAMHETLDGYSLAQQGTPYGDLAVNVRHIDVDAGIDGLNGKGALRMLRDSIKIGLAVRDQMQHEPGAGAAPALPKLPDMQDAAMRATAVEMITDLADLADSVQLNERLDGVQVVLDKHIVDIDRAIIGMGGTRDSKDYRLDLELGVNGLGVTGLPAPAGAWLPPHVLLHPSISGIPQQLMQILAAAAARDSKQPPTAELMAALFAEGGPHFGLDKFELDLGPAHFAGSGQVDLPSPGAAMGHARLTASGFDALTEKLRTEPQAAAALPVLGIMRAMARQDGDQLIWEITFDQQSNQLLVNGVDAGAMAGGGQPRPRRPAPIPGQVPAPAPGSTPNKN